jgi:PAS domain S-box-containing protein
MAPTPKTSRKRATAWPASDELRALRAVSAAAMDFAASRGLEPVLERLLDSVLDLVNADSGSIMLLAEDGQQLFVAAARGPIAEVIRGTWRPVNQSVAGVAVREGRTMIIHGRADGGQAERPVSAHPRDLASAVVTPLRVGGRLLGVLNASRRVGAPRMGSRGVKLLELLANQAAILIDNAQLTERETATMRERAQLLDLAHEAILVRDLATGVVQFWNRGAAELYGWPSTELPATSIHAALGTAFPAPQPEIEAELVRHGRWQGELTQTRRDGTRVEVASRWALYPGGPGRAPAVLEIYNDISDRKQAEAQLHATLDELARQYQQAAESQSRIRAVLDATSDAMMLVSADGQTLSVNRCFNDWFFGEPGSEVTEYPLAAFEARLDALFADPGAVRSLLVSSLLGVDEQPTSCVLQHAPQERELEVFSTSVRKPIGERLGQLYVFRDVTRERAADRAKTDFVSMVSHELRTPLTSINGYVDLFLDGEFGPLSPEQRRYLQTVRGNGGHLLALINDVLDAARLSSGKFTLNYASVDLGGLIQGVADTLRPQVAAKGQTLLVELAEGLPVIRGDRQRLTQVLTNLVSNAHKYTPEGGRLRISARPAAEGVRLEVEDTGIGLSETEQAHLFTRFFRADNPAVRAAGGTGLGLVITRSLVELHGGEIRVRSAPGQGSTFVVTLPARAPEAPSEGLRPRLAA